MARPPTRIGDWQLGEADLREILEHAETGYKDARGARKFESEGHEAYESNLKLEGCETTPRPIWKRPDGAWDFTCRIVPYGKSQKKVSEELDRRLEIILGLLPEWKVERFPNSDTYQQRVRAVSPSGRVVLRASITPWADGTFDASIDFRVPPR